MACASGGGFLVLSYEGFVQRGRDEAVATVAVAGLRFGNLSQIPGAVIFNPFGGNGPGTTRIIFPNAIPTSQLNQTSQRILALMPSANLPGFSNNLVGSAPLLDENHCVHGKLDHRFPEKSTGFLRYGFTEASVDQGSLLRALRSRLNAEFRGMNAAVPVISCETLQKVRRENLGEISHLFRAQ